MAEPGTTTHKGRGAEDLAALRLERDGYVVIERNVSIARAEIDIVAKDGDVLCFIEVRRRERVEDALLSVDGRKQARIVRGARGYLARLAAKGQPIPRCRFDVVVVVGGDRTELVKNAFEATE